MLDSSKLYLDLSGYTLTGKSALIQTIREFENFSVPNLEFEFGLFRMKDGLFDLQHSLINDWSPLRSDAAIRRFIRLVTILGNGYRRYSPTWLSSPSGYNYDAMVNPDFLSISLKYIDSIIERESCCYWPFSLHDINSIECFIKRVRLAFDSTAMDKEVKYISFGDGFEEKTKLYLKELFSSTECAAQVMHNAFEPYRAHDIGCFFENGKSIVVDRDPRSIFSASKGSRYSDFGNINDFILNFKKEREKSEVLDKNENVLKLRFEDLVLTYDETLESIYFFLSVDSSIHSKKGCFFKPYESKKNIASWKEILNKRDIAVIEGELSEYCYE